MNQVDELPSMTEFWRNERIDAEHERIEQELRAINGHDLDALSKMSQCIGALKALDWIRYGDARGKIEV